MINTDNPELIRSEIRKLQETNHKLSTDLKTYMNYDHGRGLSTTNDFRTRATTSTIDSNNKLIEKYNIKLRKLDNQAKIASVSKQAQQVFQSIQSVRPFRSTSVRNRSDSAASGLSHVTTQSVPIDPNSHLLRYVQYIHLTTIDYCFTTIIYKILIHVYDIIIGIHKTHGICVLKNVMLLMNHVVVGQIYSQKYFILLLLI
jgi:hypothetical protein